jgi:hypothetical protein
VKFSLSHGGKVSDNKVMRRIPTCKRVRVGEEQGKLNNVVQKCTLYLKLQGWSRKRQYIGGTFNVKGDARI